MTAAVAHHPASEATVESASVLSARALAGQASLYGAFAILRRSISFFLIPLYTHHLTPHDYGVLEILNISTLIVTVLGGFKIDAAFYRYYVAAGTSEQRTRVLSASLLSMAALSTLMVGLVALGADYVLPLLAKDSSIPASALYLVLGTLWLELGSAVPLAYCRATDRVIIIGVASSVQAFVTGVLAVYLLVHAGWGYMGVLWANLLGTAAVIAIAGWSLHGERIVPTLASAGMLLAYGLPMLPASVFMYALNGADKYFLGRFLDLGQVGVYALAWKIAVALQLLIMGPFGEMWATNQFRLYEARDSKLYARVSLTYIAILFQAALAIIFASYEVFGIAFEARYAGALSALPFVVFAVAIWGIVPTLDLGSLVSANRTWIRSVATGVAALVNVALCWFLIPLFGVYGACGACVGGFVTLAVATGILNYRLVDMRAPVGVVTVLAFGLLGLSLVFAFGRDTLSYSTFLAVRIVLFVAYGLVLLRALGLGPLRVLSAVRTVVLSRS